VGVHRRIWNRSVASIAEGTMRVDGSTAEEILAVDEMVGVVECIAWLSCLRRAL
jgi:hypothetical protein